jgi:hypothetical protein
MAHTITGHTIVNGPRNLIVQFNIQSDGASGQYSDFELLDLADYTGDDGKPRANDLAVKKISGATSVGAAVELKFGAEGGDHKTFFLSPINTADGWSFEEEWQGGLPQLLANPENKIRLTSLGLDASGDWITIVLWLKKKFSSVRS